jgi:hypothetical protein
MTDFAAHPLVAGEVERRPAAVTVPQCSCRPRPIEPCTKCAWSVHGAGSLSRLLTGQSHERPWAKVDEAAGR